MAESGAWSNERLQDYLHVLCAAFLFCFNKQTAGTVLLCGQLEFSCELQDFIVLIGTNVHVNNV